MKRFLMILLAFITVLSFVACGGDNEKPESTDATSKTESADISAEDTSGTESETSDNAPEKYAPLVLLEEGKVEEAYKLLIADKDNEQAKELLSKINVVFTKQVINDDAIGETSFEYEYESNGNMTKRTYKLCGEVVNISECTYDEKGNRKKATTSSSFGVMYTEEWRYDSNGRLSERITSDTNTVYEYNDDGTFAKETTTSTDGTSSVRDYEYDKNGNVTKEVTTAADGNITTVEYFYDENGKIIKIVDNTYNTAIVYEYFYDENGRPSKKTTGDAEGNVYCTSEYNHDDIGNLIKEVQVFAGGIKTVIEFTGYKYFYYPDGIPYGLSFNMYD